MFLTAAACEWRREERGWAGGRRTVEGAGVALEVGGGPGPGPGPGGGGGATCPALPFASFCRGTCASQQAAAPRRKYTFRRAPRRPVRGGWGEVRPGSRRRARGRGGKWPVPGPWVSPSAAFLIPLRRRSQRLPSSSGRGWGCRPGRVASVGVTKRRAGGRVLGLCGRDHGGEVQGKWNLQALPSEVKKLQLEWKKGKLREGAGWWQGERAVRSVSFVVSG